MKEQKKDFFISFTSVDHKYAQWVNQTLKKAGHTTFIQGYDIKIADNFVNNMHIGIRDTRYTIAVLSPDYLKSNYAREEWQASWDKGIKQNRRCLIPVKVRPVDEEGLLGPIANIDLVDVNDKEAEKRLIDGIQSILWQPIETEMEIISPFKRSAQIIEKESDNLAIKSADEVIYTIGQLDRYDQHMHFAQVIGEEERNQGRKSFGFVISGTEKDWPQSLCYKLHYYITDDSMIGKHSPPIIKKLDGFKSLTVAARQYLSDLLAKQLQCEPKVEAIKLKLETNRDSYIFYRQLTETESKKHQYIADILVAWEEMTNGINAPHQFLILMCETEEKNRWSFFPWSTKNSEWYQKIKPWLKNNHAMSLLPEFESVKRKHVTDWLNHYISNESLRNLIEDLIEQEYPASKHKHYAFSDLKKKLYPLLITQSPASR